MKKIILAILVAIGCSAACIGIVGCSSDGGGKIDNENIEIKCGDVIITYDDGTTCTVEGVAADSGHSWNDGITTTAATCASPGVVTYTCTNCDATKAELTDADKTKHNLIGYESDEDAHWKTCTLCDEVVNKTEHEFSDTENSCVKKCTICGYSYEEHSWNDGVTTTAVTCVSSGIVTYTCADCGAIKTELIDADKTKHNLVGYESDEDAHWQTCTLCGEVVNKTEHEFSDTENSCVKKCTICGYSYEEHSWNDGITTTAATCVSPGVVTYTCTNCNATKTELIDADKTKHNLVGYESDEDAHWQTCTLCGEILNKTEHDFEEDITEGEKYCKTCRYSESLSDYAYKVTFVCGDSASVVVYNNQDYTANGTESLIAYSRDSDTGELNKDGDGQVNFKVVVNDGYFVSDIAIEGEYKNKKTIDEDNDIYRITKIKSDLTVTITVLPATDVDAIYNFASTTATDGTISFSWSLLDGYSISDVACAVTDEADTTTTYDLGNVTSWSYEASTDTLYSFKFSAVSDNEKVELNDYSCSRYALSNAESLNFARVEINTDNGVFPSCNYVSAPSGCWGGGITNASYVQSTVSVYDSANTLQYSVTDNSKAKIKIRGNTSAYSEKPSYKIKLSTAADMLEEFVERDEGVNYADKEWLLLNTGYKLNYVVGSSVNQCVGTDWSPAYTYVALFMNGDYRGLYILCEAINEGNANEDSYSKMTVDDDGYIIELDAYWWNEDLYFETDFTQTSAMKYTFKYPDSDDISETSEEYLYIQNYMNIVEQKIISNANDLGDYIDIESFAVWLLTHDYLSTNDSGGSNLYLVKKDTGDSLLCMGLTWDYDSIYWSTASYGRIHYDTSFWFRYLVEDEEFMVAYKKLFNETKDKIISYVETNLAKVKTTAYDNLLTIETARWETTNEESIQDIEDFFTAHIEWMSSQLSD